MRLMFLITACIAGLLVVAPGARAGEKAEALATVAKATATIEALRRDEHFPDDWQPSLAYARAVLIVPSLYKAGFFLGGAYGNGVLLVRDDAGIFSPPAFYRVTAGSLGLQVGAEEREILYMIMTETGLRALMQDKFKLGAGVNLAIATWGGGAEAATTFAGGADIVAFSHAAGAFGGGAIEGAVIEVRADWNRAVYGANATPKSILFGRRYPLAQAAPLIAALVHASGRLPAASPKTIPAPSAAAAGAGSTLPAREPPPLAAAPSATVERQTLDATAASSRVSPHSAADVSSPSPSPSSSGAGRADRPVQLVPQATGRLR